MLSGRSRISIREAEIDDGTAFYTVYLKANLDGHWERCVRSRYSGFKDLHLHLHQTLGSKFTPSLPPKHSWLLTSHTNPSFIEDRRAKLEAYLNQLLAIEDVRKSDSFVDFLHGKFVPTAQSQSTQSVVSETGSSISWALSLIMPGEKKQEVKGKREYSSVLIKEGPHVDTKEAKGREITHTWFIKNDGTKPWPEGTRLIEKSKGTLPTSAAEYPPLARPGETVEVRIKLKVPTVPGRYRTGNLTLESPGGSFGAHYWAEIIVRPNGEQVGNLSHMLREFFRDKQVVKVLQAELPFILGCVADSKPFPYIVNEVLSRRPSMKKHPLVEYVVPRMSHLEDVVKKALSEAL
ncbi:hypothetical protein AAMO2058_000777800 [Amorphochlora amoebiformis]